MQLSVNASWPTCTLVCDCVCSAGPVIGKLVERIAITMEENLESNCVIYFQVGECNRWRGQRERWRLTDRGKTCRASAGRNDIYMEMVLKKERSQSAKSQAGKVYKHEGLIHNWSHNFLVRIKGVYDNIDPKINSFSWKSN